MATFEQLRGAREGLEHNYSARRTSPRHEFELREVPNGHGGVDLRFTGFASTTCATRSDTSHAYEMEDSLGPWVESVQVGAFRSTLQQNADVVMLVNHAGMSLARTKSGTLKLSEETSPHSSPVRGVTGLYSEARLDLENPQIREIRSAVERGDLDEMSFAFRVVRQDWNDSYTRRWITEVNMDKGDISLVNFGANPHTGGTVDLRQRMLGRQSGLAPGRALGDGPVVIPDHTQRARLELAQARAKRIPERGNLIGLPDHTTRARLELEQARGGSWR